MLQESRSAVHVLAYLPVYAAAAFGATDADSGRLECWSARSCSTLQLAEQGRAVVWQHWPAQQLARWLLPHRQVPETVTGLPHDCAPERSAMCKTHR